MQLSSSQLLQKKVRDVSLRPEGPSLLADDFSLQCPQVTHCVHVKVLDQLGDVLPLHAATFRMEVERFITEETWLSRSILQEMLARLTLRPAVPGFARVPDIRW